MRVATHEIDEVLDVEAHDRDGRRGVTGRGGLLDGGMTSAAGLLTDIVGGTDDLRH
jgi:hypothetical protein